MAKFTPIRISKNDRKEYARLVRNTRAKVRRTEKNYGIDLSNEVDLPENIEGFKTRKEFNEWKQKQSSFTNRANRNYQYKKNQYDVVASKKQISDIERNVKQAQQIADKEIKKQLDKPVFHNEKQIGTVKDRTLHMSEPDVLGIHRPKDFDFESIRNKQRLKDVEESMEKRSDPDHIGQKKEIMKRNFATMLEKSFNSDADELVKEIIELDAESFYDLYLRFPDEFNFELYYPLEGEDSSGGNDVNDINKMLNYVRKYGDMDQDFKGF